MKNKFILLATLAIGFASCEPEFENEVNADYTSGEADFSSYVAVGNSLTAGYMDGTVSRGSQMNSYPNLLAQQFALVGGGAFTQPYYGDDVNNLGGFMLGGSPILINGVNQFPGRRVLDATQLNPDGSRGAVEVIAGTSTIEISDIYEGPYNNMGVPGIKSFHLGLPGYGDLGNVAIGRANPYYVRQASTSGATVLGDAMAKNPTFFTSWIGSNDVLSYATNGGAIPDNPSTPGVDESLSITAAADHNVTGNTNPINYGANDITNSNVFASVYSTLINTLTSDGAKGVVCTIPSVTSIPYFTTVPYAPLSPAKLGGATNINALNAALYNNLDAVFTAYGEPNRVNALTATAANPLLIADVDAADRTAQISGALQMQGYPAAVANVIGATFGKCRQTTSNDLVVLTASSIIGKVNDAAAANPVLAGLGAVNEGVSYPLANKWVLTASEKAKVAAATSSYNSTIVAIANSKNAAAGTTVVAVVDMNATLNQLISGIRTENGSLYTANYFSGSSTEGQVLFSLDGVHPNARGYAVIANEIIKVINAKFKAKLPLHNPVYFPGINILPTN
jgi:lysophospholipase L1-like esterase